MNFWVVFIFGPTRNLHRFACRQKHSVRSPIRVAIGNITAAAIQVLLALPAALDAAFALTVAPGVPLWLAVIGHAVLSHVTLILTI